MDWTLADIRAKIKKLTGRPNLTNTEADAAINNYYQNMLPGELSVKELFTNFSMTTTGNDEGDYAIGSTMEILKPPMTCDGYPMTIYSDSAQFYSNWPKSIDWTQNRSRPTDILLYADTITVRPLPDQAYTIIIATDKRPSALSESTDEPVKPSWGPLIAYGAAIDLLMDSGEVEEAKILAPGYEYLKASAERRFLRQLDKVNTRSVPRF